MNRDIMRKGKIVDAPRQNVELYTDTGRCSTLSSLPKGSNSLLTSNYASTDGTLDRKHYSQSSKGTDSASYIQIAKESKGVDNDNFTHSENSLDHGFRNLTNDKGCGNSNEKTACEMVDGILETNEIRKNDENGSRAIELSLSKGLKDSHVPNKPGCFVFDTDMILKPKNRFILYVLPHKGCPTMLSDIYVVTNGTFVVTGHIIIFKGLYIVKSVSDYGIVSFSRVMDTLSKGSINRVDLSTGIFCSPIDGSRHSGITVDNENPFQCYGGSLACCIFEGVALFRDGPKSHLCVLIKNISAENYIFDVKRSRNSKIVANSELNSVSSFCCRAFLDIGVVPSLDSAKKGPNTDDCWCIVFPIISGIVKPALQRITSAGCIQIYDEKLIGEHSDQISAMHNMVIRNLNLLKLKDLNKYPINTNLGEILVELCCKKHISSEEIDLTFSFKDCCCWSCCIAIQLLNGDYQHKLEFPNTSKFSIEGDMVNEYSCENLIKINILKPYLTSKGLHTPRAITQPTKLESQSSKKEKFIRAPKTNIQFKSASEHYNDSNIILDVQGKSVSYGRVNLVENLTVSGAEIVVKELLPGDSRIGHVSPISPPVVNVVGKPVKPLSMKRKRCDDTVAIIKSPKEIHRSFNGDNVSSEKVQNSASHCIVNLGVCDVASSKGEGSMQNQHIRLNLHDEWAGFKYVGCCIKYTPNDKDSITKRNRHWKYAIIKYWDPKCMALFIHDIRDDLCDSNSSENDNRLLTCLKNMDLSTIFSTSVLWIATNSYYVLLMNEEIFFDRCSIITRLNAPKKSKCGIEEGTPKNPNEDSIDTTETDTVCQICKKNVLYVVGIFNDSSPKREFSFYDGRLTLPEIIEQFVSQFSQPNSLFHNPLHATISALRELEKYSESMLITLFENNLDIVSLMIRDYKSDFIKFYRKSTLFLCIKIIFWLRVFSGVKRFLHSDSLVNIIYWGLRCSVCGKTYHAKCLPYNHLRRPPPNMSKENIMKRFSHHKNMCKLYKRMFSTKKNHTEICELPENEVGECHEIEIDTLGDIYTKLRSLENLNNEEVNTHLYNGRSVESGVVKNDSESLKTNLKLKDIRSVYCDDMADKFTEFIFLPMLEYGDFDAWKCEECSICIYCCLPIDEGHIYSRQGSVETLHSKSTPSRIYKLYPHSFYEKLDCLQRICSETDKKKSVRCVSCNVSAHRACCNPYVPNLVFIESWRCDWCTQCISCGYRDITKTEYVNWGLLFLFCLRCWSSLEKSNYCGVCYKIWTNYDSVTQKWVQCDGCKLWIHVECDDVAQLLTECPSSRYQNYRCGICRCPNKTLRCWRMLEQLFLADRLNQFRYPVSASCVVYWRLVTKPMDLTTLRRKLENDEYGSINQFIFDILLISYNAKIVNMPNTKIYKFAVIFERKCKQIIYSIMQLSSSEIDAILEFGIKGDLTTGKCEISRRLQNEVCSEYDTDKMPTPSNIDHKKTSVDREFHNFDLEETSIPKEEGINMRSCTVASASKGTIQRFSAKQDDSSASKAISSTLNSVKSLGDVNRMDASFDYEILKNVLCISDHCLEKTKGHELLPSPFIPCGLCYAIVAVLPSSGNVAVFKDAHCEDSFECRNLALLNNTKTDNSHTLCLDDKTFSEDVARFYFYGINSNSTLWSDYCSVCGSNSYQCYMIFCMHCGEAMHYYCAGFIYPPQFVDYRKFKCAACSACDRCDYKIHSNHIYDTCNIKDIRLASALGWIPKAITSDLLNILHNAEFSPVNGTARPWNLLKTSLSDYRDLEAVEERTIDNKSFLSNMVDDLDIIKDFGRPSLNLNAYRKEPAFGNCVTNGDTVPANIAPKSSTKIMKDIVNPPNWPIHSVRCIICGVAGHINCFWKAESNYESIREGIEKTDEMLAYQHNHDEPINKGLNNPQMRYIIQSEKTEALQKDEGIISDSFMIGNTPKIVNGQGNLHSSCNEQFKTLVSGGHGPNIGYSAAFFRHKSFISTNYNPPHTKKDPMDMNSPLYLRTFPMSQEGITKMAIDACKTPMSTLSNIPRIIDPRNPHGNLRSNLISDDHRTNIPIGRLEKSCEHISVGADHDCRRFAVLKGASFSNKLKKVDGNLIKVESKSYSKKTPRKDISHFFVKKFLRHLDYHVKQSRNKSCEGRNFTKISKDVVPMSRQKLSMLCGNASFPLNYNLSSDISMWANSFDTVSVLTQSTARDSFLPRIRSINEYERCSYKLPKNNPFNSRVISVARRLAKCQELLKRIEYRTKSSKSARRDFHMQFLNSKNPAENLLGIEKLYSKLSANNVSSSSLKILNGSSKSNKKVSYANLRKEEPPKGEVTRSNCSVFDGFPSMRLPLISDFPANFNMDNVTKFNSVSVGMDNSDMGSNIMNKSKYFRREFNPLPQGDASVRASQSNLRCNGLGFNDHLSTESPLLHRVHRGNLGFDWNFDGCGLFTCNSLCKGSLDLLRNTFQYPHQIFFTTLMCAKDSVLLLLFDLGDSSAGSQSSSFGHFREIDDIISCENKVENKGCAAKKRYDRKISPGRVSLVLSCISCGSPIQGELEPFSNSIIGNNPENTLDPKIRKRLILPSQLSHSLMCRFCKLLRRSFKNIVNKRYSTESAAFQNSNEKFIRDGREESDNTVVGDGKNVEATAINTSKQLPIHRYPIAGRRLKSNVLNVPIFSELIPSKKIIKVVSLIRNWMLISENFLRYVSSVISSVLPRGFPTDILNEIVLRFAHSKAFLSRELRSSVYSSMITSPLSPLIFTFWVNSLINTGYDMESAPLSKRKFNGECEKEISIFDQAVFDVNIDDSNSERRNTVSTDGCPSGTSSYQQIHVENVSLTEDNTLDSLNHPSFSGHDVIAPVDHLEENRSLFREIYSNIHLKRRPFKQIQMDISHHILMKRYTSLVADFVRFYWTYRDLLSYKIYCSRLDVYKPSHISDHSTKMNNNLGYLSNMWKQLFSYFIRGECDPHRDTENRRRRYPYFRRHLAHLIFTGDRYQFEDLDMAYRSCCLPHYVRDDKGTSSPAFVLGKISSEANSILRLLSEFNRFMNHDELYSGHLVKIPKFGAPNGCCEIRKKTMFPHALGDKCDSSFSDEKCLQENSEFSLVGNSMSLLESSVATENSHSTVRDPLKTQPNTLNNHKIQELDGLLQEKDLGNLFNYFRMAKDELYPSSRGLSVENAKYRRFFARKLGNSLIAEVVTMRAICGDVDIHNETFMLKFVNFKCFSSFDNSSRWLKLRNRFINQHRNITSTIYTTDGCHSDSRSSTFCDSEIGTKDCNFHKRLEILKQILPRRVLQYNIPVHGDILSDKNDTCDFGETNYCHSSGNCSMRCCLCLIPRHTLLRGSLLPWRNGYIHSECLLWSVDGIYLPRTHNHNYEKIILCNEGVTDSSRKSSYLDKGHVNYSDAAHVGNHEKTNAYSGNLNYCVKKAESGCERRFLNINLLNLQVLPPVHVPDAVVERLVAKALNTKCLFCNLDGASVKCSGEGCMLHFHLSCAFIAGNKGIKNIFRKLNEGCKYKIPFGKILPVRIYYTKRQIWCLSCFKRDVLVKLNVSDLRHLMDINPTQVRAFLALEGLSSNAALIISRQVLQSLRIIPQTISSEFLDDYMINESESHEQVKTAFESCMSSYPLGSQISEFINDILKPPMLKKIENGPNTAQDTNCMAKINTASKRGNSYTQITQGLGDRYFLYGKVGSSGSTFSSKLVPSVECSKSGHAGVGVNSDVKNLVADARKGDIVRVGSLTLLYIGDTFLSDGDKRLYPVGFTSIRIFWNENHFLNQMGYYDHLVQYEKTTANNIGLEEHNKLISSRSAYMCTILAKDGLPYFSIDLLEPPTAIQRKSKRLSHGSDIESVYESFLKVIGVPTGICVNGETFFGINLHFVVQELRDKLCRTLMGRAIHFCKLSSFRDSLSGKRFPSNDLRIKRKLVLGEYNRNLPFKIRKRVLGGLVTTTLDFHETEPCVVENSDSRWYRSRARRQYDMNNHAMQYRYLTSLPPEKRLEIRNSSIHGFGLFVTENIAAGEPVIEYVGELIRDVIGDKREELYSIEQGGDGSCYMFRLDGQLIVDATRKGTMSRFINHSCDPNCLCRIITCENGLKHIVIFAKCDLKAGDEVTYDYQFGVESETRKLLCLCGAPNCLGRMN